MSPRCKNCKSHKTSDYARVFGDEKGNIYRCHDCLEEAHGGKLAQLSKGAAAKPDFDPENVKEIFAFE